MPLKKLEYYEIRETCKLVEYDLKLADVANDAVCAKLAVDAKFENDELTANEAVDTKLCKHIFIRHDR